MIAENQISNIKDSGVLPLFSNSNEALRFGRYATAEERFFLRWRRLEYHRAGEFCKAHGRMDAAIHWFSKAQFDREAIEAPAIHEANLELLKPDQWHV